MAVQLLAALVASAALFVIYHGALGALEAAHGIVRGAAGSEASAMVFGEYYPNPGGRALPTAAAAIIRKLAGGDAGGNWALARRYW